MPGQLFTGPTDLSGSSGTALGLHAGLAFRPRPVDGQIRAQERRGQVLTTLEAREDVEMFALLRGMDPDAMSAIFPSVTIGASGQAKVTYPVGKPALGDVRAVKLLFVPAAAADHHAIILYNAIPRAAEDVTWKLSKKDEATILARFLCVPDTTGRVYQTAILAEVDL